MLGHSFLENNDIAVRNYTIKIDGLPAVFEGFSILQISDLHSKRFGKGQRNLLELIQKQKFNLVAITGDLVNRRHPDIEPGLELVKGLMDKPVYFVPGNHEWRSSHTMKQSLLDLGVKILENQSEKICIDGRHIWLVGVDDPHSGHADLSRALAKAGNDSSPNILLAHAPEIFEEAVRSHIDLVLAGHTHGGQVRIPLIGAIFVPGQGLFPKYDYGGYIEGKTQMVISGGLGESLLPVRFNILPEIALIKLTAKRNE